MEEAIRHLRVAEKSDPLSFEVRFWLSSVLLAVGRYDEAESYCSKLPQNFPPKASCVASARLGEGRVGEAIQVLEADFYRQVPPGSWDRVALGCAFARVGRRAEAEEMVGAISKTPLEQAQLLACLGERDRAFEALDRAVMAGPFRMGRALTRQEFALLRGDRRLKELRKRVGLPE
jgi:tetratricopeptide (TPR) repeat protein